MRLNAGELDTPACLPNHISSPLAGKKKGKPERLTDVLVNWCLGLRWFLNYGHPV